MMANEEAGWIEIFFGAMGLPDSVEIGPCTFLFNGAVISFGVGAVEFPLIHMWEGQMLDEALWEEYHGWLSDPPAGL